MKNQPGAKWEDVCGERQMRCTNMMCRTWRSWKMLQLHNNIIWARHKALPLGNWWWARFWWSRARAEPETAEIQALGYFASCSTQIAEVVDDKSMCLAWDVYVLHTRVWAGDEGGGTSVGLGLGNVVEGCWFGSSVWGVGMEQELMDELSLVGKARDGTCCPGRDAPRAAFHFVTYSWAWDSLHQDFGFSAPLCQTRTWKVTLPFTNATPTHHKKAKFSFYVLW